MDPNKTLNLLRSALAAYERQRDNPQSVSQDTYREIAEHAEALNVWLTTGGALPKDWEGAEVRGKKVYRLQTVIWSSKKYDDVVEATEDGVDGRTESLELTVQEFGLDDPAVPQHVRKRLARKMVHHE
jgi:hypothetical protein